MSDDQMQDWFSQTLPTGTPKPPAPTDDWFSKNLQTAPDPSAAFQLRPPTPSPPAHVWSDLASDSKEAGIGALKATGRTATNLLKVADWLFNGNHDQPFLDAVKAKIGQPTGTAQNIGAAAADIGTALLPVGEIGKAADAAEAAVAGGGALVKAGARILTQGAGAGATAAIEGQDPTLPALVGGGMTAVGTAADTLAPLVKSSAAKSMIRALGPAGGRGPTSATNLSKAEDLAPGLVESGFMPLTQDAARTAAKARVQAASSDLQSLLQSPVASADFDQPKLLQAVQAERAKLLVNPGNGQPSTLPSGEATAADALWGKLENDVQAMGTNPTDRAIHALKAKWNATVNWNDPAAGTLSDVYSKGGNLIRAQMSQDAQRLSRADAAFSKASDLQEVLEAPTVRRPGAGIASALTPFARPAVGGTIGAVEGYREGGVGGLAAGALTGATLGALIQSPGFRYVSASLKNQLANALDKGDSATASQLAGIIASQAQRFVGGGS